MNRRELEKLSLTLESTPAWLARAAAELPEDRVRHRGTAGGFSLVEQVWHLADLEREAYAVRIRRILAEDDRCFRTSMATGSRRSVSISVATSPKASFTLARTRNLQRLRDVSGTSGSGGQQEGIGRVGLSDVPRMMASTTASTGVEIAELVARSATGSCRPPQVDRRVSAVA